MLYICPTPIGNLEDITIRVINILKEVDFILCEDTRHTKILLEHYNIDKKLISYHKFNEKEKLEYIVKLSKENELALVSDAGMPLISDPGGILVKELINEGVEITVLPGASAFVTALAGSGLDTKKIIFLGFLEKKSNKLKEQLNDIKYNPETIIIYESKMRIKSTIKLIKDILGFRKIVVAKEITKKFERYIRSNTFEIINELDDNIKGEFVILIEGFNGELSDDIDKDEILMKYENLISASFDKKEALDILSSLKNIPKRVVYNIINENK